MGTGVGEMMLMSAAVGGGSAALTGGDPLKGALLGGLTGGLGAGISGALSAAAPAAAATAAAPATTAATTAATAAGTPAGALSVPSSLATTAPAITSSVPASYLNPDITARALSGTAPSGISTLPSNISSDVLRTIRPPMDPSLSSANLGNYTPADLSLVPRGTNLIMPTNIGDAAAVSTPTTGGTFTEGMQKFIKDPMASIKANPLTAASAALKGATGARKEMEEPEEYDGPLKRFKYNPDTYRPLFAEGGIATLASGGYDQMVGEEPMYPSNMARGGITDLGSYSDGGRMLRGPGDGMSDSIPASISGKRPARLADGEFVVPADVVSHLGNGSTDAGAKQLYAMMNKVRKARTGRKAQGREINPRQYVPA